MSPARRCRRHWRGRRRSWAACCGCWRRRRRLQESRTPLAAGVPAAGDGRHREVRLLRQCDRCSVEMHCKGGCPTARSPCMRTVILRQYTFHRTITSSCFSPWSLQAGGHRRRQLRRLPSRRRAAGGPAEGGPRAHAAVGAAGCRKRGAAAAGLGARRRRGEVRNIHADDPQWKSHEWPLSCAALHL